LRTFNAQQSAIVASLIKTDISWLFEIDKDGDGDIDYYWSTKAKTWSTQAYTFAVTEFSPLKMERNRSEYGINAPPAFDFTISNEGTTLYPSDFTGGNVTVKLVVKSWVRKVTVTVTGGTIPAVGATMTGVTSGETAILVSAPDAWTGDVACYFTSQSGAFESENVSFTGGGTGTIAADLTYAQEEAEVATWNFDFISVAPKYQTLQFDCQSWIEKYLTGVYPNTQTLDSLWPSDQNDYTGCVPLIFGTCYIPVHTAFITDDRFYVLGPATPTYTITKSRSPIEVSTVSEWLPANYAFNQYTKAGGDGANYKVFQLIGTTVTEDPTGNILYKLWNALTGSNSGSDTIITNYNPGAGYLSLPTKYSRDDTVSMTTPTSVLHYILEDFGIPSARIDSTSMATVAATIAGWGLTWNVGLFNQDDRKTLLSSLLQQCHVELIIRDKVYFKVHAKASQRTITATDVIEGTFDYRVNKKELSNCGYVLYPDPSGDVPVSKLTKTLVPALAATTIKSSIEVDCQFVSSGSIHAQVLGSLSLQRQLLVEADVSLNAKSFLLALEPDDFVTMSGDNYGAGVGNTYPVLIDSMSIGKDLEITVAGTRFSAALSDFEDPSPSAIVVGTDTSSNSYQVVYSGPEATGAMVDPTIFNGVMKASSNVGMSGLISGGVDWRIWAGDTFANRSIAPFRVDNDGNLYATNAYVEGIVSGSYVYGSSLMTKGTYLATSCLAAAATLDVGSTADFPVDTPGAGDPQTAWFIDSSNDRDVFTYTGKTSTTLTGCSGVLAHTVSASNKPLVVPYVKGAYVSDVSNEIRGYGILDPIDPFSTTISELFSIGLNGPYDDFTIAAFGRDGFTGTPARFTSASVGYEIRIGKDFDDTADVSIFGSKDYVYQSGSAVTSIELTGRNVIGRLISYGSTLATDVGSPIDKVVGLYLQPAVTFGEITELTDVLIETPFLDSATIGTHYAINQKTSTAINKWAGSHNIATGKYFGLGAAKGRMTFTYAATDDILFSDCTVTFPNSGLHILDTNASHDLIIAAGSDLSADRILTITTGDSARTLTFTGDATLNQAVDSTASPVFVTVKCSGLTDDYIPYHVNDATGFANGPTKTNVDSAISLKHAAVTVSAPISISTQALSLVNDAAATVTEIDTGALANSDTVIPTSKAVTTAIAAGPKIVAWVNFDGTTNTAGYCTIRASYNVTSVADNGTGDYTINFTNAIADANYAVITTQPIILDQGTTYCFGLRTSAPGSAPTLKSTTQVRLLARREADFDIYDASVVIFR